MKSNDIREFLRSSLSSFFIIVTLINLSTYILGSVFRPDERFGYDAFLSPIFNGLLSMIPVLVMYSKKEYTLKQLIIRKIIQLLLIEAIIVAVMFRGFANEEGSPALILSLLFSIFVIFVLVHLIELFIERKNAREMNAMLAIYQKRENADTKK